MASGNCAGTREPRLSGRQRPPSTTIPRPTPAQFRSRRPLQLQHPLPPPPPPPRPIPPPPPPSTPPPPPPPKARTLNDLSTMVPAISMWKNRFSLVLLAAL